MLGIVALAPSLGYRYWGVWHFRITNALYFVPQYVFPFGYTWRPLPEPRPDAHAIGHGYSLAVWLLAVVLTGWFGRRLRPGAALGTALVVLLAVTALQQGFLRLVGWHFWCDGP